MSISLSGSGPFLEGFSGRSSALVRKKCIYFQLFSNFFQLFSSFVTNICQVIPSFFKILLTLFKFSWPLFKSSPISFDKGQPLCFVYYGQRLRITLKARVGKNLPPPWKLDSGLILANFFDTILETFINEEPVPKIRSLALKFWMWWPHK